MKGLFFAIAYFAASCLFACRAFTLSGQRNPDFEKEGKYELFHFELAAFETDNVIELAAFGRHFKLALEVNEHINPVVRRYTPDGVIVEPPSEDKKCYYRGNVLNAEGYSSVRVSICKGRGVRGRIKVHGETFIVEASAAFFNADSEAAHHMSHEHVIYRESDLEQGTSASLKTLAGQFAQKNAGAGADAGDDAGILAQLKSVFTRRRLASYNGGQQVVEIFFVAEKTSIDTYGCSEATDILSTIVNGADELYNDGTNWDAYSSKTIGTVTLSVKAVDCQESYSGNLRNLQCSGCDKKGWKDTFEEWALDQTDWENDYDYGFIWLNPDGYTSSNSYSTSGYSSISGLCSSRQFGVALGLWDKSSHMSLFAHELGHCFGMSHDDSGDYDCSETTGYMASGSSDRDYWTWCSQRYMADYFKEGNGLSCLSPTSRTPTSDVGSPNPTPTPPPTPPPIPSNSGSGCVRVDLQSANSADGDYVQVSTVNGWPAYYSSSTGLYLVAVMYSGISYYALEEEINDNTWSIGYCKNTDASIFDCDGQWRSYRTGGTESGSSFGTCLDSSPVSAPTPPPVTAPTPPPVSASCDLVVAQISSAMNGVYVQSGTKNGELAYYSQATGLYLFYAYDSSDGSYWWSFEQRVNAVTFDIGYCGDANVDLSDCNDNFYKVSGGNYYYDSSASFSGCGQLRADIDPCVLDSPYPDTMCFYPDGADDDADTFVFEVDVEEGCSNQQVVYTHTYNGTELYLHFHSSGKWIISEHAIRSVGPFMCEHTDLLSCQTGVWQSEVQGDDYTTLATDENAHIAACGASEAAAEKKGMSMAGTVAVILLAVVLVGIFVIVAVVFCRRRKQNKEVNFGHVGQKDANETAFQDVDVAQDATTEALNDGE